MKRPRVGGLPSVVAQSEVFPGLQGRLANVTGESERRRKDRAARPGPRVTHQEEQLAGQALRRAQR